MKQIQIPEELFNMIVNYFLSEKFRKDESLAEEIEKGLEEKLDKMINRELFTKYKKAPTGEEREQARQQYLNRREILEDFRTDRETHKEKI